MKTANTDTPLDRLVGPLGDCLTPESARRLLALKADRQLQAHVAYLAGRCNEGLLASEEHAEYGSYVKFGTFIAILKSKARQLLVTIKQRPPLLPTLPPKPARGAVQNAQRNSRRRPG